MSPKRRFLSALLGGRPDRLPVGNVVSVATMELMELADARFPEAHFELQQMTELAAAGHTTLGYDTVMPVFSVVQEAAALGCSVDWGSQEMMPTVHSHPFAGKEVFEPSRKWFDAPSIQVVLGSLRMLRKTFGHKVVVVGKAMGPWSLSYHLMGVEQFLITAIENPDRARRAIHALKTVTIAFAQAQVQAGADIVCVADHATGDMISPAMYRELLLPVHREIVSQVQCPIVLHCCGRTGDRVRDFAEAGFDCFHLESQVPIEAALRDAAGRMTLMGNINNPQTLLFGTAAEVATACRRARDQGVQILAPECAVPLTTPLENLRTLVNVADGP